MPVKMWLLEDGRAAPVVVCDYCGERIEDALEGNYEWVDDLSAINRFVDVYFVHKRCSRAHEAKIGTDLDSMEMNVLLPYLANNLKVNWDKATEHAAAMDDLHH